MGINPKTVYTNFFFLFKKTICSFYLVIHKLYFFATETNTIEFQKTKKEKEILMKERNALQIEHDALTATQNETASTLQETMLLHQKAAATIETHDQHVQKVTKKMDDKIVEH